MKKRLLTAAIAALAMTGCLSSAYHFGLENDCPYNATIDAWNYCVCVWDNEPRTDVENAMDAYTKLVYPFWIVDFPLEIVLDTAFMPFDAIVMCCDDVSKENVKGRTK